MKSPCCQSHSREPIMRSRGVKRAIANQSAHWLRWFSLLLCVCWESHPEVYGGTTTWNGKILFQTWWKMLNESKSLLIYPHVISYLYDFISSVEYKRSPLTLNVSLNEQKRLNNLQNVLNQLKYWYIKQKPPLDGTSEWKSFPKPWKSML